MAIAVHKHHPRLRTFGSASERRRHWRQKSIPLTAVLRVTNLENESRHRACFSVLGLGTASAVTTRGNRYSFQCTVATLTPFELMLDRDPSEKPSRKLGPCNFGLPFAAWEPICCLALSETAMASMPSADDFMVSPCSVFLRKATRHVSKGQLCARDQGVIQTGTICR
jgi:hypothetical protein